MKHVCIIGGGLSGLAAGSYLQMNGYTTEVFEQHSIAGGLCTAWKRKGYTIDGCVHFMVGSGAGDAMHGVWRELIDMNALTFSNRECYAVIEEGGEALSLYADVTRLADELRRVAPADETTTNAIIKGVRTFIKTDTPIFKPVATMNIADKLTVFTSLWREIPLLYTWSTIGNEDLAARITTPILRHAFTEAFPPFYSAFTSLGLLAFMHKKTAGYPIGGSARLAHMLEDAYRARGGRIHYNRRVAEVCTERDRVTGVRLADGSVVTSDIVISAANAHDAVYSLLKGEYIDAACKERYEHDVFKPLPGLIYVSFGVARTFPDVPRFIIRMLDRPVTIDAKTTARSVNIFHYSDDPTLAPQGKTLVTSMIWTYDYAYWCRLRETDRTRYREEKARVADAVLTVLEERFPGFRDAVEVTDVATPATFARYTNAWCGSTQSWQTTPAIIRKPMRWRIKRLRGFYFTGHWVAPTGGISVAAMTGKHAAQVICRDDGVPFRTS